jgi:hypothetical protein
LPHTALVQLTGGGGVIIVDKFGAKQRLPIALHSTATAFEEVRIGLNKCQVCLDDGSHFKKIFGKLNN